MLTGRRTVNTSAVQIFSSTADRAKTGLQIYASSANTGTVYVGESTVTANSSDSTDGYPLTPGKELLIPLVNPNPIYAVASASGQTIWFINI